MWLLTMSSVDIHDLYGIYGCRASQRTTAVVASTLKLFSSASEHKEKSCSRRIHTILHCNITCTYPSRRNPTLVLYVFVQQKQPRRRISCNGFPTKYSRNNYDPIVLLLLGLCFKKLGLSLQRGIGVLLLYCTILQCRHCWERELLLT